MRTTFFLASIAAALAFPSASLSAQDRSLVQGTITDATSRRGVEGVAVSLADGIATVTDRRGRFELRNVLPGTYHVRLSRIGYRPKTLQLPITVRDAGDDVFVDASLEPLPVELEPVVVRGDTATIVAFGQFADFYRRRRLGFGRFFTRRDIERRNPFLVTDLFWTVPGARLSYDRFGSRVVTFRGQLMSGRSCLPNLYLDGMRMMGDFTALDDLVYPDQVEGIEVYASDVSTPLQFSGGWGGCGAIVIWTR